MKIYIARHGQDDDSVRGGWSDCSLTDLGVKQSVDLADEILSKSDEYNIGMIVSSDIIRAKQTALIISEKLSVPVKYDMDFREVNTVILQAWIIILPKKNIQISTGEN